MRHLNFQDEIKEKPLLGNRIESSFRRASWKNLRDTLAALRTVVNFLMIRYCRYMVLGVIWEREKPESPSYFYGLSSKPRSRNFYWLWDFD